MKDAIFARHTMGEYLEGYIAIKMPSIIEKIAAEKVVVRGVYRRDAWLSYAAEKSGKIFNWKRPTYEVCGARCLLCNCFPGVDYVSHYAQLISAYSKIKRFKMRVDVEYPAVQDIVSTLKCKTNLLKVPRSDIVILGIVHNFFHHEEFCGDGDFMWKYVKVRGRSIVYLGCKFSIWGDIAGYVLRVLAENNGLDTLIYIGKLGTLRDKEPNRLIATGDSSSIDKRKVAWKNIFSDISDGSVIHGKHVTLPSVLQETKDWLRDNEEEFDFVDPEIGRIALAAQDVGVNFSYLHIISDSLKNKYPENLSNERKDAIVGKRIYLSKKIRDILKKKNLI